MADSEIAPNQRRSELATIVSVIGCLLAAIAVIGLVVMATTVARLNDELASHGRQLEATKSELARLTFRLAQTEKQATFLTEAARPRSISPAQEAAIARLLTAFAGQNVEVEALGPNYETATFAEQVTATLRAAGIAAHTSRVIGPSELGIAVMVRNAKAPPAVARGIQSAFSSAGIKMDFSVDPGLDSGTCIIVVGAKPTL